MNLLLDNRADDIPLMKACDSLAINRSTVYWRRRQTELSEDQKKQNLSRKHCTQSRALSDEERNRLLVLFNSDEFIDQPPMEMYHTLLERGENLCSISTMHRILRENKQNGERRQQRAAQHHAVPRLCATRPNEVWSWDCSKLATVSRGVYLTLYVVLDLYSRFVVAWMVSRKENSSLAQQLMDEATHRYSIAPNQLTIHQDRGSPMIAHRYIDLMGELGVTLSHSRPRVSNDNAISEAQFKTQKYQPDCVPRARASKGMEIARNFTIDEGLAPRSRLAGAGFKPLQAAEVKSLGGERCSQRCDSNRIRYDQERRTKVNRQKRVIRYIGGVETGYESGIRDEGRGEPVQCSAGIWHIGGVTLGQALVRNEGTCRPDAKGAAQLDSLQESQSTDAGHRGGDSRSRVEGSVMGLNQRGIVVQFHCGYNL